MVSVVDVDVGVVEIAEVELEFINGRGVGNGCRNDQDGVGVI
jgi:hypothetical protein